MTHKELRERRVEVVSTLTVDRKKYVRLANRVLLKAIQTEEEYDHMVAAVEELMDKGEGNQSPEESALLETIAILIDAYDDRHYPLPAVPPAAMLSHLMETSGRTAKNLLPIFGTRGRVSEVLSGKRSISKEQAKRLGAFFKVAADLFI
jgi:HTH-type transcriptional regulator/antitoxin HigA